MAGKAKHRQPIIDAAVQLFRQQGYAATGLAELVESSGSPKGSLYHYFPDGKPAIAVAAVEEAGRRVVETMQGLAARSRSTAELLHAHADLLATWMEQSGFRDGCPITTVLLELSPDIEPVRAAGQRAYAARIGLLTQSLMDDGFDAARAERVISAADRDWNAAAARLAAQRTQTRATPAIWWRVSC